MSDKTRIEDHLAEVTEETVANLVEGANFIVVCPVCDSEWAMGVGPFVYAAASNTYGPDAVERRFERLRRDIPEVSCGACRLHGLELTGGDQP